MNSTALSLSFSDEQVYDNLIYPYKKNRMLSDLVVKLLTVYYYNPEVRNAVDSDGMYCQEEISSKYDEYFRDIGAMIALMDSQKEGLADTIKTGLQDIIDTAEAREDIDQETWGTAVPRVSTNLKQKVREVEEIKQVSVGELEDKESNQERLTRVEEKLDMIVQYLFTDKVKVQLNEDLKIKSENTIHNEENLVADEISSKMVEEQVYNAISLDIESHKTTEDSSEEPFIFKIGEPNNVVVNSNSETVPISEGAAKIKKLVKSLKGE